MAESQEKTTEAQPQAAEQVAAPEAPAAPEKVSPEEFQKKLATGEIPMDSSSPEELIEKMVDFGGEQKPAEGVAPEQKVEAEAPAQTVEQKPTEQTPETPVYKNFGEFLAAAKEKGIDVDNAHDLLTKTTNQKKQLSQAQTATERWKKDAVDGVAERDALKGQVEEWKKKAETPKPAPQAPAPKPAEKTEPVIDEPEIPMPNLESLDSTEAQTAALKAYAEQVRARESRMRKKELGAIEGRMNSRFDEERTKTKTERDAEKAQWNQQREDEKKREADARAFDDSVKAATDFAGRHKEFSFEDGKDVRQKNDEYVGWLGQVEYVKGKDARFANRDLATEFLNGVPDAVEVLSGYGLQPPPDARKMALLIELNQIALNHKLHNNERPDFDAAYALKKQRDGVDVVEVTEAKAQGANQALEVVQARQATPPQIGAGEATTREENKVTSGQVQDKLTQLQARMSTESPEAREKTLKEIEQHMAGMGLQLSTPT